MNVERFEYGGRPFRGQGSGGLRFFLNLHHLLGTEQLQGINPALLTLGCPNLHKSTFDVNNAYSIAMLQSRDITAFSHDLSPDVQGRRRNVGFTQFISCRPYPAATRSKPQCR